MVLKLGRYKLLRNTFLTGLVSGENHYDRLLHRDTERLRMIVEKLDGLYSLSDRHFVLGILVDENLFPIQEGGLHEIHLERTKDRKKTAELLEEDHKILRNYRVRYDFYINLGEVFDSIRVEPSEDINRARAYAVFAEKEKIALNSRLRKKFQESLERELARKGLTSTDALYDAEFNKRLDKGYLRINKLVYGMCWRNISVWLGLKRFLREAIELK